MDVVGYTDRMSAAPGEPVSIMLSSVDADVQLSLVRPCGSAQGSPEQYEVVPSTIDGAYAGRRQPLRAGSYVHVDGSDLLSTPDGLGITLWTMPTLLSGRRTLMARSDAAGRGWQLGLDRDGCPQLVVIAEAGERSVVRSPLPLRAHEWAFIGSTWDPETRRLELVVVRAANVLAAGWASRRDPIVAVTDASVVPATADAATPLLIGGSLAEDEAGTFVSDTFSGKIAMPRLFARALTPEQLREEAGSPAGPLAPDAVAAWDFAREISGTRVVDVAANALHGVTVQRPARAATGPRWDGEVVAWPQRPDLYDAIRFHDDDLDDAGWGSTATWTVDEGLPSGIYAVRAEGTESGVDHLPVVVVPPLGRPSARVLFVAPLYSWLAYGNWRVAYFAAEGRDEKARYVVEHRLNGLYDRHTDASSVCYASWLRPNLEIRPDHLLGGFPHQLSADLFITDWLRHEGVAVDVVTDEELHREGASLLSRYRVVISGTHTEYWTAPMLDALAGYLHGGGRYMYLSGNGLFKVIARAADGGTVEVRRQDSSSDAGRHVAAGEGFMSLTGEPGGLWQWRGRPANCYVGVGSSGLAFHDDVPWTEARGAPYRRQPGSFDTRARFICEGLRADEPIGDFPNPVFNYGAAGFEIDRADRALGTPAHALVVATARAESGQRWTAGYHDEEDERTIASDVQWVAREARSDLVFFETRTGGAVFSTGSIAWSGALPHNGYDNNVARVSGNVLRRFLSDEPFKFPA